MKTLSQVAKVYCANSDGKGGCIWREKCLLTIKKACRYFRESVWPICDPNYKYAMEAEHYPNLVDEYTMIYGRSKKAAEIRECACGEVLKKRHRLCDKCRKKSRRQTNRENTKKYRVRCNTINPKTDVVSACK